MDLLTVEIRREAGWVIVAAGGQVDVATAPRLHQELQALATRGEHRIVLDLAEVGYVDEAFGLGVIVGAVARARRAGGAVAVVVIDRRLRELLDLTGVGSVVAVHPSVEAALAAGAGQ